MADDVPITAGAGTTIATDQAAGGEHYQQVKLVDGTLDSTAVITGDATKGLKVDARPQLGRQTVASAGLTIATTAYTAGDQLGTILEFTSMAPSEGYGKILGLTHLDDAGLHLGIEAFFFDRSVTLAADNAAFTVSDANAAFCLGSLVIPGGSTMTDNRISTLSDINMLYKCNATSLFVAYKTLNAHTFYTAIDDLHLTLWYEQLLT